LNVFGSGLSGLRSLGLVAIVLGFSACAREPLHQTQAYVFGTLVEVAIYGETEARAAAITAEVLAEFDRLNRELNPWKPGLLSQVNAALAVGDEIAAPELVPLVEDATRLFQRSEGLFNPAIGRLIQLWGFDSDEFKPVLPAPGEVEKLVAARPQMTDLSVGSERLKSGNPAVLLDFGGYAKGYALDRAAAHLKRQGVAHALINVGGNIEALGSRGRRPWRIGLQHPRASGAFATLELQDGEAIGTSGDYQRYFLVEGRRYCHIIDPRSGWPAQGVQAVTVVAPRDSGAGVLSDAASKPLFISGVSGWRDAARKMGIKLALLIDENGEVHVTQALKERMRFTAKDLMVHVVP
jgi:FAD:protein FMN transferase